MTPEKSSSFIERVGAFLPFEEEEGMSRKGYTTERTSAGPPPGSLNLLFGMVKNDIQQNLLRIAHVVAKCRCDLAARLQKAVNDR